MSVPVRLTDIYGNSSLRVRVLLLPTSVMNICRRLLVSETLFLLVFCSFFSFFYCTSATLLPVTDRVLLGVLFCWCVFWSVYGCRDIRSHPLDLLKLDVVSSQLVKLSLRGCSRRREGICKLENVVGSTCEGS